MNCEYCEALGQIETVYEDQHVYVVLNPNPAVQGHLLVIPKVHAPIMESLSDQVMESLFVVVQKLIQATSKVLQTQSWNVLVQNGMAAGQLAGHCMLHLIPRRQGDNIILQWKPLQIPEQDMNALHTQLQQEAQQSSQSYEEKEKEESIEELREEALCTGDQDGESEDYLLKQMRRMP
jgi:histidine triad (HIT) family protein